MYLEKKAIFYIYFGNLREETAASEVCKREAYKKRWEPLLQTSTAAKQDNGSKCHFKSNAIQKPMKKKSLEWSN